MKKHMTRAMALLLCMLMLVTAVTACGGKGGETATTTAATTVAQGEADTTTAAPVEEVVISRENYPDSLPEDLKFEGKTFNFMVRGDSGRRDEYIADGVTGEIINDATLAREQVVEDRFGIQIEWVEVAHNDVVTSVRAALNSGLVEFDLIAAETDHIVTLGAEGFFMNWIDAPYIDFEKPW